MFNVNCLHLNHHEMSPFGKESVFLGGNLFPNIEDDANLESLF